MQKKSLKDKGGKKLWKKAVLNDICVLNIKWNMDNESACGIVSYEERNVTHRWWSRDLSRANEDGT